MSDDLRGGGARPDEGGSEDSASAIFAAILRDAAERAKPRFGKSAADKPSAAPEESRSDKSEAESAGGESSAVISDEAEKPAKVERQRIRRVVHRRPYRRAGASSFFGGFTRTLFVVCVSTGLVATLLTWFTNPQFLNPAVVQGLQLSDRLLLANAALPRETPTPVATPNWRYRIGIISGHRGRDSGAVCEDEYGYPVLREVDINFAVAERVVAALKADNYSVDLLDEGDPRLDNYQGTALVSIHANTCYDFGERVSGYIVAKAEARPKHGNDALLRECVAINFGDLVPLERSFVLTVDMTNYHVFRVIHPLTPAVILEMGYMLADQEVLTSEPDLLARGIVNGVYCYLGLSGILPPSAKARYQTPLLETPTPSF